MSGMLFVAVGILSLIAGLTYLVLGAPYALWYSLTLGGGILVAVMGPMLPMLARRYRAFETQRMAARDRADAL